MAFFDGLKNNLPSLSDLNPLKPFDGASLNLSEGGTSRTDGNFSPIGLVSTNGVRTSPGFTPNEFYNFVSPEKTSSQGGLSPDSWFGRLLETHPYFTGDTDKKFKKVSTKDRWDRSKDLGTPGKVDPFSTRDYLVMFNDIRTDYFRHGLQIIDRKNAELKTGKNEILSDDGAAFGLRETNYATPYENSDPVMFGFEIIIDAVSSPLLNGSVEDFIEQFRNVSEIASKANVFRDFKIQFSKLFRTKGRMKMEPVTQKTMSVNTPNYANQIGQTSIFEAGREAYLSYYIQKIGGLENLIIANSPNKKKYLTNYREDQIKISFMEDVSLTMGTLAHLYRLMYWSKPNAKSLIPENLLRFNCDIVISECRNYQRVRKAIDTGDLESIKENLSRHIYSLRECQMYFDTPTHDSEVDLAGIKDFAGATITMDYKYVTTRFERWTPDTTGFGQYVSYNNGAIWKVGNPGSRAAFRSTENTGTVKDTSVPKFYTVGSNFIKQNGVKSPIVFESYSIKSEKDEPVTADGITQQQGIDKDGKPSSDAAGSAGSGGDDGESDTREEKRAKRRAKLKEGLDAFKERSKEAGEKLFKDLKKAAKRELINQVNDRLRLLNNSIDKIRNAIGIGRMRAPTNVYNSHPPHAGIDAEDSLGTLPKYPNLPAGVNPSFFFDVQNSIRDFAGGAIGGALGGIIRGGR